MIDAYMKKLSEIVLFCSCAFLLLSSRNIENGQDNGRDITTDRTAAQDTAGLTDYLITELFPLEILPPSSGVRFFGDGLVFLSNTKNEAKMLSKHVSFGSIEAYTASLEDTTLGKHIQFSPTSSFSYPCEAIAFTADYKTMYYAMIARKEKREKIYRAEYRTDDNGETGWVTDPQPMNFCTGDFLYTHPSLSADGNLMVFASDRTGTFGGTDIFLVRKNGDTWSVPENLGKMVNTPGNELFPFLDQDNNLYFSTDGLPGLGGYDIYTSRFNLKSWDKPVNLSRKINTENDDIAFSIDNRDGRTGFYTTRQKAGRYEMQLRKVTLTKSLVNNTTLTIAYIFNGSREPEPVLIAEKPATEKKQEIKEPGKTVPAETKGTEQKTVETKPVVQQEQKPKTSDAKVVTIQQTKALPESLKDVVIYRVQFLSTSKPRKEEQITVNGVTYKTYEYFYLDAYRYTVGEFTSVAPARELQNTMRKYGHPQAFVAAFKNNTRSLDLTLFK